MYNSQKNRNHINKQAKKKEKKSKHLSNMKKET